jgi:hypothetical protein
MTVPWKRSFEDLMAKTNTAVQRTPSMEITLLRKSATGVYDENGRYNEPEDVESTIEAHIQPANGIELQDLPEGRHGRDTIKIYTDTQLYTVDEAAQRQPDKIIYDSKTYQVDRVWDRNVIYKALATKVEA